ERRMLASIIVGVAFFMYGLDSTIVTTAIPPIAQSFGVNPVRLDIAIVAFIVAIAIFVPISGWLADRFGASFTFGASIAVFTLGSLVCGLSSDIAELSAARFVQGIGGAMVFPVGRLVVLRNVAKSDYVRVLAMLGLYF